jgi:CsoR family transcriptional regulator, copper-sensing transcriptional repressor
MHRDCLQKAPLLTRVRKITGQTQGIARMIEDDRDCTEILNTISAVHSALRSLEAKLLEDHIHHCVTEAASDPAKLDRRLDEIVNLYKRRLS